MTLHPPSSSSDTVSAFIFSLTFVSVLWVVGIGMGFFSYGPPRAIQGQSTVTLPLPVLEKNVPNLMIGGKPYLNNLSGIHMPSQQGTTGQTGFGQGQTPYSAEQLEIMASQGVPLMGTSGGANTGLPAVGRPVGMSNTGGGPRVIRLDNQSGTQASLSMQEAYGNNGSGGNGLLTIEVPANATSISVPVGTSATGQNTQAGQPPAPFQARLLAGDAVPPETVKANWPNEFGKSTSLSMSGSGKTAFASPISLPSDKAGVSIIIGGLGLDTELTRQAIEKLPPQVTLGFVPYAVHLEKWVQLARSLGHETVLEIPLEPFDYPRADVGDAVLLTTLSPAENNVRLEWLLGRSNGFAGVMNYQGGKFLSESSAVAPIFQNLASKGLYMLETRLPVTSVGADFAKSVNLSYKQNISMLDDDLTPSAISKTLKTLLDASSNNKTGNPIVAIGYANHGTLNELEKWLPSLAKKKVTLIPASQAVQGQ